jgi:Sec-independent protein translocase protein TatA
VGRLPEIGGAVGKAIREFREATGTPEEEEKKDDKSEETHASVQ